MSFKREYKITLLIFALLWIMLPTINLIVVVFQIIVAYAIFSLIRELKKDFNQEKIRTNTKTQKNNHERNTTENDFLNKKEKTQTNTKNTKNQKQEKNNEKEDLKTTPEKQINQSITKTKEKVQETPENKPIDTPNNTSSLNTQYFDEIPTDIQNNKYNDTTPIPLGPIEEAENNSYIQSDIDNNTLKQTLNDISKNLPEETTKTENKSFTQQIHENKEIIEPVTSNINTLEKDKTSEKTYLTPYMDIDSIPKEFNDLKQNKEDKSNIEHTSFQGLKSNELENKNNPQNINTKEYSTIQTNESTSKIDDEIEIIETEIDNIRCELKKFDDSIIEKVITKDNSEFYLNDYRIVKIENIENKLIITMYIDGKDIKPTLFEPLLHTVKVNNQSFTINPESNEIKTVKQVIINVLSNINIEKITTTKTRPNNNKQYEDITKPKVNVNYSFSQRNPSSQKTNQTLRTNDVKIDPKVGEHIVTLKEYKNRFKTKNKYLKNNKIQNKDEYSSVHRGIQ
ncbi:hypothetical protein [Methanosphaera sp.]|uniref:hypothetical protein n=1 Tax=Methanosphaera sp. TaxID=2666342 RepID=UPI0026DF8AAB|nr:hypothetical protein [Methanosphaera sp.]MDO5821766.1 hypothetical protein [Methanosphaera sp.]